MDKQPVTAMSIKMIAKITSYDGGELGGILDSMYFDEPLKFAGVVNMIEMMETTFDALGFPDKSLLPRTFGKAKERMRRHEMDISKLVAARQAGSFAGQGNGELAQDTTGSSEPLATFEILVGFRHNAEWQGKLHWAQKDVTKEFSSIVEMVKLIDEALQAN